MARGLPPGHQQGASGRSRRLSSEEAALWVQLVQSVTPLPGRRRAAVPEPELARPVDSRQPAPKPPRGRIPPPLPVAAVPPAPRPLDRHGLDANWDRRLAKGAIAPDFTLDLHGASLDAAYARLDHGLTLAVAQGARVVLVIAGRPRSHDGPHDGPADRGSQRGAIRAKLLDWLAHGSHAGRIAAVRGAHPRHGGAGAVYVVLRRGV